jgi:hypothetical protein
MVHIIKKKNVRVNRASAKAIELLNNPDKLLKKGRSKPEGLQGNLLDYHQLLDLLPVLPVLLHLSKKERTQIKLHQDHAGTSLLRHALPDLPVLYFAVGVVLLSRVHRRDKQLGDDRLKDIFLSLLEGH